MSATITLQVSQRNNLTVNLKLVFAGIEMGGCRCTYRNCLVKTDGKTHMFHYPVFDKIRCHQWLVNAHRLEFLNLKVSQLKNRVVCQHHFKDEYFMNFKKEKLTFKAIPTEDGPYCDPKKHVDNSQDFSKLYPIILQDIDNDYCSMDDKKANFSLKYVDFLTNSESMDSPYLKAEINIIPTTPCDSLAEINFLLESNLDDTMKNFNHNIDETDLLNENLISIKNNIIKSQPQPMLIVQPYSDKSVLKSNVKSNNCVEINPYIIDTYKFQTEPAPRPKPKVTIISEKKINNFVPIIGNFKPISPSVILNVSNLKSNNLTANDIVLGPKPAEDQKHINKTPCQPIPQKQMFVAPPNTQNVNIQYIDTYSDKHNTCNECNDTSKVSLLKNKLPQERMAAIQEKRKFNMKLKDVLETCVVKMEEPEQREHKSEEVIETCHEKVQTSQKSNILPNNNNEAYLSLLESRMTRMENLLLNKIDQNSQRIVNLQNSLKTTSNTEPKPNKKAVSTQTIENEEAHKKYLYSEISKYLSSESNNLIYEELFINKFAKILNTRSTRKRKKCR